MMCPRHVGLVREARSRGQRGAVSVELVIAFPLLLLLLLALMQLALWTHAEIIADAAASHALDAARVQGGSVAAGDASATAVLTQLSHGILLDPHVQVTRTTQSAAVTITGHAVSVIPIPGITLPVRASLTGPAENFTAAGGQHPEGEQV
jgi:Flp pilus assembly protein TadG